MTDELVSGAVEMTDELVSGSVEMTDELVSGAVVLDPPSRHLRPTIASA